MLLLLYLRSSAYIVLLFLLECASALVFSLVPFVGDPDYRRKKSALAYIPDMDGSALQPDPISYLSPALSIQSFILPSPYHSAGMIEGDAPPAFFRPTWNQIYSFMPGGGTIDSIERLGIVLSYADTTTTNT